MVGLSGWHIIMLCPRANATVNYIISEGSLHPQSLSSTRELYTLIQSINLASDHNCDYCKIACADNFKFSSVWQNIRHASPTVDWGKVIWHRTTARKFCFTAYKACMGKLAMRERLKSWSLLNTSDCVLCNRVENLMIIYSLHANIALIFGIRSQDGFPFHRLMNPR